MSSEEEITKHITELLREYIPRLQLEHWDIRTENAPTDEEASLAGALARPEYRQLRIHFDVPTFTTGDSVEEVVCHELVHALTWPLAAFAHQLCHNNKDLLEVCRYFEEQVTTHVADVITRYHRDLRAAAGGSLPKLTLGGNFQPMIPFGIQEDVKDATQKRKRPRHNRAEHRDGDQRGQATEAGGGHRVQQGGPVPQTEGKGQAEGEVTS